MVPEPPPDPVLNRFRAAMTNVFGDRVQRLVLFGSRARGDHRPDSDYDVALFLRDLPDRAGDMARLADIEAEFLIDTGLIINTLPFQSGAYQDQTGFMGEIRHEGIDL